MQSAGKILLLTGLCLCIAGVIVLIAGNKISWFGNLPGDIKIKRENFNIYIPVTSMLLVSLVLSAVLYIAGQLRK